MFEDKNVYSEKLANDIQVKLSGFPFSPQNFKLSYDLDTNEAEKRMSSEKLKNRIHDENKNSRMLFEALKLRHIQPFKRPSSAASRPNSGKDINGNQTHGKFYHLNFEPIRIEDYKHIEDFEESNYHKTPDSPPTSFPPPPLHHPHPHNAFMPNVTDVNNNIDSGSIVKNSPFALNPSPQIIKLHKRKQSAHNNGCVSVPKEEYAKKRPGSRRLPSLPSAPPISRLSSTVPDLIATTKMPSVAEEIMAVFACEKKKQKFSDDAPFSFTFPHCCSPEIIFGLRNEPENTAQHTMKDLGNPDTIDPVKKYSDLYLNESYVKNIICFKCDNIERVYDRLKEEDDEEEEEEEEEEEVRKKSLNEVRSTSHLPPVPKELIIDKSSENSLYPNSGKFSTNHPHLITPPSCSSIDSGVSLSRINSANSKASDGQSDESDILKPPSNKQTNDKTTPNHTDCNTNNDTTDITSNTIDISKMKNFTTNNTSSPLKTATYNTTTTSPYNTTTTSPHTTTNELSNSIIGGFTEIESYLDECDATHRGCHKFLPRHPEELAVEIGDGLFVEKEHDDLWCEGINLRTKQKGIFPTVYATDLSLLGEAPKYKQFVSFLGSIQIGHHTGHQVLCKAIKKFVKARKESTNTTNLISCLEIDETGVRVSERKKKTATTRILSKLPSYSQQNNEHVFLLKNITFCGILPNNEKYLGIITKHPTHMKFACHVFQAPKSGRPIVEAIGNALSRFHQEFLSVAYPIEDIYFE